MKQFPRWDAIPSASLARSAMASPGYQRIRETAFGQCCGTGGLRTPGACALLYIYICFPAMKKFSSLTYSLRDV